MDGLSRSPSSHPALGILPGQVVHTAPLLSILCIPDCHVPSAPYPTLPSGSQNARLPPMMCTCPDLLVVSTAGQEDLPLLPTGGHAPRPFSTVPAFPR